MKLETEEGLEGAQCSRPISEPSSAGSNGQGPVKNRVQIMAILNITPDSFTDGGRLQTEADILKAAGDALEAGADILDIGGESTRPGAGTVPVEEELQRILPALNAIRQAFPQAVISVDTRKSQVAREALQVGASIINDVSGLQYDPAMAAVVAEFNAGLVVMHSQGTPETMQLDPHYPKGVIAEISAFFENQTAFALHAGVSHEKIILDPGFGFGKTLEHNLTLLNNLSEFHRLGFRLLVGTSRKSFLTLGDKTIQPDEREALTAASLAVALKQRVDIVRVHNVREQGRVLRFLERLENQAVQ